MNKSDIEFTVGLDTSPAEQKLSKFLTDVQSHKNRVQKLLDNPQMYSNQAYESKLSKLETMQNRYGIERVNINSNIPSNEYHRFMNLQNAVARYEREINKISERANSVLSVANSYSTRNSNVYQPNFADAYMQKFANAEAIKRNQTFAQGAYATWLKTFGNNNVLSLPAPQEKSINYEMHPWNEKNMADVNKKDNIELKDKLLIWGKILTVVYAVKKTVEGLAKVWRFGADTATSRNNNINEELGFFSTDPVGAMNANVDKTRSMLYAGVRNMGANAPVSKEGLDYATSKITEMWTAAMSGRNVDARTTIDAQRLKDFFGIDLTVAGLLTGEREGKTATDIQIDMMEKVEQQLSKLNEADDITKGQVIDSLKNILGSELIDAIVSNYNKNLKIEIGDRLTLSEKLLGVGGSALSPQDLTAKTNSAVTALSDFHTALENLKNTITVTFAPAFVSVTNSLTDFVNWLNRKMTKTTGEKDETGGYSSDVAPEAIKSSGHINWISKGSSSGNIFGTPSERASKANELLKNATSVNDVLDAVYLLNPFVQTEGNIEGLKTRKFAREIGSALVSGTIDPNSSNPFIRKIANYEYGGKVGLDAFKQALKMGEFGNLNEMKFLSSLVFDPSEFEDKTVEDFLPKKYESMSGDKKTKAYEKALKALEKYNYNKNKRKFAAINQLMSTDVFGRWVLEIFGEGGAYDLKEDESLSSYLFDPTSYETAEDYYNAIKSLKESFDANRWGREYIQSFDLPSMEELAGADKKLDFGEVKFRLTLTDQAGTVLGSQEIIGNVQ